MRRNAVPKLRSVKARQMRAAEWFKLIERDAKGNNRN